MRILTIDIGGTKLKLGVFEDGALTLLKETDTGAQEGAKKVVERIIALSRRHLPADAVAVATCGQVDPIRGSIRYANDNMPGYTGTELREILETALHVDVTVENDAYAAAIGEGAFGCARGCSDFICLTIGTGIGGGLILDGKPYYGAGYNCGAMIGEMLLNPEADGLGSWAGTFEECASTTALVRRATALSPDLSDGRKIFAQIDLPNVKRLVDSWLDEVAWGVVSLAHVYNVPLIVLGGGVMEQEYAVRTVREKVAQRLVGGFQGFEVKKAALGNLAGMYGAAVAALERGEATDHHPKEV